MHKDFLAIYSLEDDTFGVSLRITYVPSFGNTPYHVPCLDGQDSCQWWSCELVEGPRRSTLLRHDQSLQPEIEKSNEVPLCSITNELRAKPDGGFFITYMGSADGTSPGRHTGPNAEFNVIQRWPKNVDGTLNILGNQFSVPSIVVDFDKNIIFTPRFTISLSSLKPSLGVQCTDIIWPWELSFQAVSSIVVVPGISTYPHLPLAR